MPYNNLARLYLAQDRIDEAIGRFEAALAADPQNPAAYMTLGTLYEKKNDYKKAIGIYEQALDVHPNLWAAANNLAFLISEDSADPQDLARALALARRADDMRPGEPVVKDTMAWIYFKQGDLAQARQILDQLLTDAPDNPVFNYHMGVVSGPKRQPAGGASEIRSGPGRRAGIYRQGEGRGAADAAEIENSPPRHKCARRSYSFCLAGDAVKLDIQKK